MCIPGSYSDSAGIEIIRKHVAEYIEKRDNLPSNVDNIFLCAGASEGIRVSIISLFPFSDDTTQNLGNKTHRILETYNRKIHFISKPNPL